MVAVGREVCVLPNRPQRSTRELLTPQLGCRVLTRSGKVTLQVREGVLAAARSSGLLADTHANFSLSQAKLLDSNLELLVAAGLSKFDHREAVVPKAGLAGVVEPCNAASIDLSHLKLSTSVAVCLVSCQRPPSSKSLACPMRIEASFQTKQTLARSAPEPACLSSLGARLACS